MNIKIITNNPRLRGRMDGHRFDNGIRFVHGTVKEVVIESRNAIMDGMVLAADPLAGRKERANPCLSVILKQGAGQIRPEDVLRVEQLLDIYYKNIKYLEGLNKKQQHDYEILDQSLVESALFILNKSMINNTSWEEK